MSKVTAVFDKPRCCESCPCSYYTEGVYMNFCQLARYLGYVGDSKIEYGDDTPIPDWCPLQEVSE